MTPHNHARSEGARYERAAVRRYLRRRIKRAGVNVIQRDLFGEVLDWVLNRQKRYDAKPGGLGRM